MIRLETNFVYTRCYSFEKVVRDEKVIQLQKTCDFWCECEVNCFKFGCISRQISIRLWVSIMLLIACLYSLYVSNLSILLSIRSFIKVLKSPSTMKFFFIMTINELF